MKASGTALGPGRAHGWRTGATTGWMTVLETKKKAQKTIFTVDGRCLMFCQSPKAFHILCNEAYGFGSVAIEPGYNVGMDVGNC